MAGPLQEEKIHQGNIIFFFSFLIGIAITEATQCLVCSKFSVDLRTGRLSSHCLGCLSIAESTGLNGGITYHEKDVTALFIISIILLAGSSRDDHTNQSKRQVMCYHRNKDDFFI